MKRSPTLAVVCVSGLAMTLGLSGCESTQSRDAYAVIDGEVREVPGVRMGDASTINAIIEEGRENSQVMDILYAYTHTHGPRLTGSTRLEDASWWARDRFAEWGLSNARLEQWGTIATRFDRGETSGRVMAENDGEMEGIRDVELTTLSWSVGTDGPVRGRPMMLPTTVSEYESNRGLYEGAWVLIAPDYTGRSGIRSNGYLMRERMDERHALRTQTPVDGVDEGAPEQAHPGVAWEGSFNYNGSEIPLTLHLDESEDVIGGFMSIDGFSEGAIMDAARDGDTVTFTWKHAMGTSDIVLVIEGDKAAGTSIAESGNEYAIDLTKRVEGELSDEERAEMERLAALESVLMENPAGFVSSSKDDRVWTTSSNNWRERELADYPSDPEVHIRQSDFDFVVARMHEGIETELEFDLRNELTAGPVPVSNVIAEIPGTKYPDEVVIISAHLDSWDGPGSMGTTDNGTGSAVMTETARILSSVGARPDRTIRVILWTGEEQGLLGARAYVESLSDEERSKISAAFVDDGGTNYQGGIPAADYMVEYLAAATAPTNGVFFSKADSDIAKRDDDPGNDELGGYMNVNIRPTGDTIQTHGGSDHAAFNAVGIPGFFWDEVGRGDYGWTWHTQNDTYDEAIKEYLIQSATNMAITAYNLANAPTLLPREGETFGDDGEMAAAE